MRLNRSLFRVPLPFRSNGFNCSFGNIGKFSLDSSEECERLFAFAITEYASPRVFDYDTSPDGIEALSNLLRAEEVLAVVRGKRVVFKVASTVAVKLDGTVITNTDGGVQ